MEYLFIPPKYTAIIWRKNEIDWKIKIKRIIFSNQHFPLRLGKSYRCSCQKGRKLCPSLPRTPKTTVQPCYNMKARLGEVNFTFRSFYLMRVPLRMHVYIKIIRKVKIQYFYFFTLTKTVKSLTQMAGLDLINQAQVQVGPRPLSKLFIPVNKLHTPWIIFT